MTEATLSLTKHEAIKRHVLGLSAQSNVGGTVKLPILAIAVGDRIIPEDAKLVAQLKTSIREVRQTTPILVRRSLDARYILVDGLNRLSALKELGETEVLATVLNVSTQQEAKACEAISNSHRRQKLTALDRALTDFEFVQYIEQKVSQDAAPRGGRQPREKFYTKTARELGVSPDQIARSCKIAKILPYVQQAVRRRKLEDNQSVLLEIAASGDDVTAQVHTLARLMPKVGKPEADHPSEEEPIDQFEHRVDPRAPSQSESSQNPDPKDFEANPGKAQSLAASTKEQQKQTSAPPPSCEQTPNKLSASAFGAIKREWETATALRRVLRESAETDRKRFLEECFIPEVFATSAV